MIVDCPDYLSVWPQAEPMLQRALDKTGGEYDTDDIKELMRKLEALLWVIKTHDSINAVFVTQIHKTPRKKIGSVMWAAGEGLKDWSDIVDVFTDYFKENDCDYFDICGRKGWLKQYESKGFREQYTTIRKKL